MVTETEIFGGQCLFPEVSSVEALRELYNTGTKLWEKVLRDQFVHKEMGPFYAALQLAKRTLECYNG